MTVKDIMNISQNMQALAIASESIKLANKKKKSTKDFVDNANNIMIGSALLKANSDFIGSL
jgi:hypothetical protein